MEKTERLYERDAYCASFCSTVLACEEHGGVLRAALAATAFYPEGGGQPADRGALGGARVVDVHEEDGVIWHTVTAPVRVGETVQGDVDWARRFDHMQQHTGEHILSGIAHEQFGCENVGFGIGEDSVRIDFSQPMTDEMLALAEELANGIVQRDEPVTAEWPDPVRLSHLSYRSKKALEGPVRIVTAGSADVCACCGTHVARTGEVGLVKITSAQSYKGGTRVTIACGMRALEDYRRRHDAVHEISVLLSAKPDETPAAVRRVLDENAALHAQLAAAENARFEAEARTCRENVPALRVCEGLSGDSVRRFASSLAARCGLAAVLCRRGDGFSYAVCGAGAAELAARMNAALGGKGGGRGEFAQGSAACTEESARAFFAAEGFDA